MLNRRDLLQLTMLSCGLISIGAPGAWAQGLPPVPANQNAGAGLQTLLGPQALGPLQVPDANGIRLPAGFTSRVLARSGQAVSGTSFVWHGAPDGGATFAISSGVDAGGWVYVSNAELYNGRGSVSAMRFDAAGQVAAAYSICSGFTTKGDNRVWSFNIGTSRLSVVYDDSTSANPILTGVDNITVSSRGHLYVSEDGGDMQICVIGITYEVSGPFRTL